MSEIWRRVYHWVRSIPSGKVATYGQISALMDRRISAAAVGWALRVCPEDVPWHRVVNAKGGCSTDPSNKQQEKLEAEGVSFDELGRARLVEFGWDGSLPGLP